MLWDPHVLDPYTGSPLQQEHPREPKEGGYLVMRLITDPRRDGPNAQIYTVVG